eukprot:2062718-Amphidinium_carterae.1
MGNVMLRLAFDSGHVNILIMLNCPPNMDVIRARNGSQFSNVLCLEVEDALLESRRAVFSWSRAVDVWRQDDKKQ